VGEPPFSPEVMVGTGGTFTNLGEMLQYEREGRVTRVRGYEMTRGDLVHLLDRLRETPLPERRRLGALNPKRADIIVAGAAVVVRLAKHLDTRRILVSDRGVRDGLIVSMIEDLGLAGGQVTAGADDRMESIHEFARKCRSNERHCRHVAAIATQLFDAVREPFELPSRGRDILEAAALLHEVGYLVNHAQHHKHAYHLIMHGDFRGFSPGEVELVANVARYHRRAFPQKRHENLRRLDAADRRLVRQLSAILRIADGLDRTHGQVVTNVRARVGNGATRVRVVAAESPATDLADAKRKSELFERTFGVTLVLGWDRPTAARTRNSAATRDDARN
jgi:exopolyphosphatase/guanosine-5'-triphosphate,3'-diphosphate pyrophosphatase